MLKRDLDRAFRLLREALVILDRLVVESGSTSERVREVLQAGSISTNNIAILVRKRRRDVAEVLKLMEQAGDIRRTTKGWELS